MSESIFSTLGSRILAKDRESKKQEYKKEYIGIVLKRYGETGSDNFSLNYDLPEYYNLPIYKVFVKGLDEDSVRQNGKVTPISFNYIKALLEESESDPTSQRLELYDSFYYSVEAMKKDNGTTILPGTYVRVSYNSTNERGFGVITEKLNDTIDDRDRRELEALDTQVESRLPEILILPEKSRPMPPKSTWLYNKTEEIEPEGIVVHAMGERIGYQNGDLSAKEHLERVGLSVHGFIYPDGRWEKMTPAPRRANHVKGHNSRYLGFELLVEGTHNLASLNAEILDPSKETYSDEQMATAINITKEWMYTYNISKDNIFKHSQLDGSKTDPGPAFNWEYFKSQL